jgi:thiol-disulfide isomerase/thioredoxin
MHGDEVQLSDRRRQVILLDFWATWCGLCLIEIPGFIEFLDTNAEQGLAILGISIDDPFDALRFYAQEMEMDYPVHIGDGRDDVKNFYGPLIGFPSTILIDGNGNICHSHSGYAAKAKFEAEILSLL